MQGAIVGGTCPITSCTSRSRRSELEVAFLFVPEEHHDDARQFFADVKIEHSGPVYECAYIDPAWSIRQIEEAMESVPPLPDPRPTAVPWWFDPFD